MPMEFFDVIRARRSIRKFTNELVPLEIVERALDAAILAPNSSNLQTWNFYWVRSEEKKAELVRACFSQAAARTAQELLVIVADPTLWKRSCDPLVEYVESINAPKLVRLYYKSLVPVTYRAGFLNLWGFARAIGSWCVGFFRPVPRGPHTFRDLQEVALKSSALAAENFVLAMSAQGYSTCMMEGFDEVRVKRLLCLPRSAR
ncbi:MAG: nitroreductase family protein, partial [Bdellovibrionales bacterium]|nr:nitroreductase family protein [Bdellovibrionales bacterium]